MHWKKRTAKIAASYLTGYTGGFTSIMTLDSYADLSLDLFYLFTWPLIAGLAVMIPQVAKMLNEYGMD